MKPTDRPLNKKPHTLVEDNGVKVKVTFYNTIILEFDRNTQLLRLCTGGWATATTMRRLNQALSYCKIQGSVSRTRGKFSLYLPPYRILSSCAEQHITVKLKMHNKES